MQFVCNLHTHTHRCRHADPNERAYIENALAGGIDTLGFSDHAPYVFEDGYYSNYRMFPEDQEGYVRTLEALREEYRGKIDIKIGYEAEYYPKYFDAFLKMIRRFPCDYMILGQHFLQNETNPRIYSGECTEDPERLETYVNQVCEAIDTGLFTYIAHPDLCCFTGGKAIYDELYSKMIIAARDAGLPLEINLLGLREKRFYPDEKFFELCGKLGAPVCIGSDAHSADTVTDPESYAKALEWCRRYNLILIDRPVLRPV